MALTHLVCCVSNGMPGMASVPLLGQSSEDTRRLCAQHRLQYCLLQVLQTSKTLARAPVA